MTLHVALDAAAGTLARDRLVIRTSCPPEQPRDPLDPWRRGNAAAAIEVSVVIPIHDEADNILPLIAGVETALAGEAFEVIVVDDGSLDNGAAQVRVVLHSHPRVRLLRHERCCGQSAAIHTGVRAARGQTIVTLDGDGQNDPADIPLLLATYRDPAAPVRLAMVIGHRRQRNDGAKRRLASAIANRVRRWLLRDDSSDTGCGLKVFARSAYLILPYFDHMHRFLPALIRREGLSVQSVPVRHHPRRAGRSKYGTFDRLGQGIVDLLGVKWLQRRRRGPGVVVEVRSER